MKTYKRLYERVCSFENVYRAYLRARCGKRYRDDVLLFSADLEQNLHDIADGLRDKSWWPGPYRFKEIHEPKPRAICVAPFADRVVHHALCNVIGPIFERTFIHDSYACRPERGTHRAIDRLTHFLRKDGSDYVLSGDVRKFFPSVAHCIVVRELEWKIADPDVLWLCRTILVSYENEEDLAGTVHPKGIPIGNLTSQWFANIVGNCLDQHIKCHLREPRYLRYMDNFIVLHRDKGYLRDLLVEIERYLGSIYLVLNPKSGVFPASNGVPFLGYIVYADHRRVLGENVRRGRRRLRRQARAVVRGRMPYDLFVRGGRAWFAHLEHADTYHLRRSIRREARKELGL